jgi:hypothetical protein
VCSSDLPSACACATSGLDSLAARVVVAAVRPRRKPARSPRSAPARIRGRAAPDIAHHTHAHNAHALRHSCEPLGGPAPSKHTLICEHPCLHTFRTQPSRWAEGTRGTGWRLPLVALVPLIGGNIPARDKGGGRVLLGSWGGASGHLPPVLQSTFASGARAPEGAKQLIMCWHPCSDI